MARRILLSLVVLFIAGGLAPTVSAAPPAPQIEDPAGDHPVPFMDFTEVRLAVVPAKSGLALETTFVLAGAVTPESRTTMTGYSFTAKVGKCDLLVRFIGYPDGGVVSASPGFVTTKCGEGRDIGGTWKINDNRVIVLSPLRDLKGVAIGATMTDLAAFNAPGEGQYHDDTTAPAVAGDAASSAKSWTIG